MISFINFVLKKDIFYYDNKLNFCRILLEDIKLIIQDNDLLNYYIEQKELFIELLQKIYNLEKIEILTTKEGLIRLLIDYLIKAYEDDIIVLINENWNREE